MARAASPGYTRQYIARYRDFVISRDVHAAISSGSAESEIANFPKNFPRKFFRAMTATAFPRFLHLKTIDHFAWFFPRKRQLHGRGKFGDHSDNAHTVAILICGRPDNAPRRFDTRSLTLRSVTSPGFWDIKGFSTESRYDVAEN